MEFPWYRRLAQTRGGWAWGWAAEAAEVAQADSERALDGIGDWLHRELCANRNRLHTRLTSKPRHRGAGNLSLNGHD